MINKCNLFDLEKLTGITPRDSWCTKARRGQVYFIKNGDKITAFLYKKDAKEFLQN